jgi:ribose/xylose/arabinose/galactoside ABC-type transport system permease subunit
MNTDHADIGDQSMNSQPSATMGKRGARARRWVAALRDYGALIGMIGVLLIFGIINPKILTIPNLSSVVDQSSGPVVMAVGMAIIMSMRGVDLSLAQVADAAGLLAAMLLVLGWPWWTALAVPIVFALVVGGINAGLMAYLGVPAIIGTLGMMFVVRSFELVLSHGSEAQVLFTLPPDQTGPFFYIGQGSIGPVPVSIVVAAIVVAVAFVLTNGTPLGRYINAVGGNVRAAFLAGVDHRRVFAAGFVASAVCAALGGMILTSRAGLAAPGAFEPYLLDAFVAVYLGSLLAPSGRINVLGAAIGALFVGLIGNALTLMGAGAPARYIAYGVVIIIAMTIGVLRRQR